MRLRFLLTRCTKSDIIKKDKFFSQRACRKHPASIAQTDAALIAEAYVKVREVLAGAREDLDAPKLYMSI